MRRPIPEPDNAGGGSAPRRTAVALSYDPERGDSSPLVVASGEDYLADQILAVARRHSVPIREDKALAGALAHLDVGSYIPPEMYRAVAEVLSWVYRMESGGGKGKR